MIQVTPPKPPVQPRPTYQIWKCRTCHTERTWGMSHLSISIPARAMLTCTNCSPHKHVLHDYACSAPVTPDYSARGTILW